MEQALAHQKGPVSTVGLTIIIHTSLTPALPVTLLAYPYELILELSDVSGELVPCHRCVDMNFLNLYHAGW